VSPNRTLTPSESGERKGKERRKGRHQFGVDIVPDSWSNAAGPDSKKVWIAHVAFVDSDRKEKGKKRGEGGRIAAPRNEAPMTS